MPKRKERMAGYIRESDPNLADSTTIESQAKAVRQYGEKEHYIYEPQHEYREALSAYTIPYMQRPQLLKMLKAAERREFDVLVVSEVRAISRRQIEVLIIFDMLQKWGVRLETVKEKFADDAMGKAVLALRAMFVEIEREQSKIRMDRGRADRIAVGKAPNGHPKPAYGYILVDTKVEVKGRYELNHEIVYTDANDKSWSRVDVCLFIFHLLKRGGSLHKTAHALNDMGIPAPRGGIGEWTATTILLIVNNPIYTGEVYANRFKQIEKRIGKSGKPISKMIERPKEEWIRLPDAPAIIDKETALAVQRQLQINKLESLRNNKQKELGLLRSGYIFCGICGRRMSLVYPSNNAPASATPSYHCTQRHGKSLEIIRNHKTQIHLPYIDAQAKEKIVEVLLHPEVVRAKVAELREAIKPVFDAAHIKETVENIRRAMKNLFNLAQSATDDETMAELTQRMNNLEKQKRDAEAMLHDLEEAGEERVELEAELVKFEKWVEDVRPLLTDPTYMETASYGELRIAIRILGLRCTVYPTQGGWPYRYHIEVTVPEVLKKVYCVQTQPGI